jgi:CRISPR/Cas system endoribonuclease Cas6 (RAMP superfamily)
MLARFAEYSGIGGNRTGGFGVTKFMPKKAK